MKITENTKINFGNHRNTKVRDLPDGCLTWMSLHLRDTDFHRWAIAAGKEIERRKSDNMEVKDLEQQADDLLRQYGFDPKNV